jgi:hypothetical protein
MEKLIVWHRLASRGRDEAAEPKAIATWARRVRTRFTAGGGEVLAQISGTVVAQFDPSDAADVLELALELLNEADAELIAIALGVALGTVEAGAGRAIELAELLAARAHAGELVLDPNARARAGDLFLFGRHVSTGVGGPRGGAIDRSHPRRDACAEGIARLGPPPIAPITATLVPELLSLVASATPPAVILRGPVGAGAIELVAEAAAVARPRALIGVGAAPGGIVPLASLRYGLIRAFGSEEAMLTACGDDVEGRAAARLLRAALRGGIPPLEALAGAIGIFLSRVHRAQSSRPCWAFLTPLALVDAASLGVLLRARELGAPLVILARYPLDARLPGGIAPPLHELKLPPLGTSDARAIAQSVLGEHTDPEVTRRVAALGGETPLGVVEVARALIASGDLVIDGDGFAWRGAPRSGTTAMALEEVLEERLAPLEEQTRRMLEAICVAPDGGSRELIAAIAERDGLDVAAQQRAIAQLAREGWLAATGAWPRTQGSAIASPEERPHPSSSVLRRYVVQSMPPARHDELHRFAAAALLERCGDDRVLGSLRAETAWYEIEGGLPEGLERLSEVANSLIERDYRRAAARITMLLAKLAPVDPQQPPVRVSTHPPVATSWDDDAEPSSTEILLDELERDLAREQGEAKTSTHTRPPLDSSPAAAMGASSSPLPPPPPKSEPRPASFAAAAETAVRSRDVEALEALMQRAVASGSDLAAVARFRALADLIRGDVRSAKRALQQARGHRRGAGSSPQESLAEAAVALASGDPRTAIRSSLRALARARRGVDRRGEIAAMRTLAACYRAIGRDAEAAGIDAHCVES